MHRTLAPFALSFCILASAPSSFAEDTAASLSDAPSTGSAELSGAVTDPSGAVIPGATVRLQGAAGVFTATSDASGHYAFAAVPPGTYTLSFDAPGFAGKQMQGFTLKPRERRQLDVAVEIAQQQEQVAVSAQNDASLDHNGDAIRLKGEDLNILSTDTRELQQQLQAMAGGSGSQLYVDGFSGGRVPPKSSIREIRINQDPYSADYYFIVFESIQIFTKPGTDTIHGGYYSSGTDSAIDSKNPFTSLPQPFYGTQNEGWLSGPVRKNLSYSFDGGHFFNSNTAVVNAETLDADNQPINFTQAVPNPTGFTMIAPRFDAQLNAANTFTFRYEFDRTAQSNAGASQLMLASQAYDSTVDSDTFQASNTTVVSPKVLNEARFQYIRSSTNQTPSSTDPTLIVEGAFTGGGSNQGKLIDNGDTYELQDYMSVQADKHGLRFGVRQRLHTDATEATAGFNGEYIFPTLTAYQAAEQALASGVKGVAGANQFSITTGNPSSSVQYADTAVFANDTWNARQNLTLGFGVRGEGQNHTADHFDVIPRFGFSYNVGKTAKKPALFTLEGGAGMFYQRLPIADLEQVARLNGTLQTQYVVNNPTDFPNVPTIDELSAQSPSSVFLLSHSYNSPYSIQSGASIEHDFGKIGSATLGYSMTRGVHQLLEVNTNAPLPGTYNPNDATSGVHPYGGTGQRNVFETAGVSRQNRVNFNTRLMPVKGMQIFANYTLSYTDADSNGVFPSNQYDIGADYGRASTDIRNRLFLGFFGQAPWNFEGGSFIVVQSGAPFDIVLGNDLNGDGQFNDRPSFATDLARTSVVSTRYGVFDTDPIPGQRIIPNNYGPGPGLVQLNVFFGRTLHFGPVVKPPKDAPPPPKPKPGAKPLKPERRFSLDFAAFSENVLNHVNAAPPIGTLGSPLFGVSNALANPFSNGSSANRTVNFQVVLQF